MATSPTSGPGGGSGAGVGPGCVLRMAALNVAAAATYPVNWTGAIDNVWDYNALTSLPAGIGLTATLNGTDNNIEATEAGFWSFSLYVALSSADATWIGTLDDQLWTVANLARDIAGAAGEQPQVTVTYSIGLPIGGKVAPLIFTNQAATGAQTATALMSIVRLA